MDEKEFEYLLDKYFSGKANEAERELLHQFFDQYQIEDVDKIWGQGEKKKYKKQTYLRILSKVKPVTTYQTKSKHSIYKWAAVIIPLIIAGVILFQFKENSQSIEKITYETQPGQKSKINLPDGSIVYLNSTSSLNYDSDFTTNRVVRLKGEAFFEVRKDIRYPFKVESGPLNTLVLGTSFNIRAYDTINIAVTVASGRVQVVTSKDQTTITEGEQAYYRSNQKQLNVNNVEANRFYSWKDGYIKFENETLESVATELERWFGVKIIFHSNDIKYCRLTLKIHGESLGQVLDVIQMAGDISYEINQKKIFLSGKGCQ